MENLNELEPINLCSKVYIYIYIYKRVKSTTHQSLQLKNGSQWCITALRRNTRDTKSQRRILKIFIYYCYYDHHIMSIKKGLVKEREGYLHHDTPQSTFGICCFLYQKIGFKLGRVNKVGEVGKILPINAQFGDNFLQQVWGINS